MGVALQCIIDSGAMLLLYFGLQATRTVCRCNNLLSFSNKNNNQTGDRGDSPPKIAGAGMEVGRGSAEAGPSAATYLSAMPVDFSVALKPNRRGPCDTQSDIWKIRQQLQQQHSGVASPAAPECCDSSL
jgi:hypothetical protein